MKKIKRRHWCPQPKTSAPTSFTRISRHLRNSKIVLLIIPATIAIAAIVGFMLMTAAERAASVKTFDFVFRYGVGAKNELNTYSGTFTLDMVSDPSITADLKLTVEDKWQILQKINETDFFNLPSSYPKEPNMWMSTQVDYYIKAQYGSRVNEITWNNNSHIDGNVEKLQQLADLMIGTIQGKAEYKALPTPRSGYV